MARITGVPTGGSHLDLFAGEVNILDGQVSIGRSIMAEQSQIATFLSSDGLDADPILFFRLLLFLLDEFCERLCRMYSLLGEEKPPKAPKNINCWANKYAKHKEYLFVQHFAVNVFEDDTSSDGIIDYMRRDADAMVCLRSGFHEEKVKLLDDAVIQSREWPSQNQIQASAFFSISQDRLPVIIVPKLEMFVRAALKFLEEFIVFAKSRPQELQKFQSGKFWPITREVEEEIAKVLGLEDDLKELRQYFG